MDVEIIRIINKINNDVENICEKLFPNENLIKNFDVISTHNKKFELSYIIDDLKNYKVKIIVIIFNYETLNCKISYFSYFNEHEITFSKRFNKYAHGLVFVGRCIDCIKDVLEQIAINKKLELG